MHTFFKYLQVSSNATVVIMLSKFMTIPLRVYLRRPVVSTCESTNCHNICVLHLFHVTCIYDTVNLQEPAIIYRESTMCQRWQPVNINSIKVST